MAFKTKVKNRQLVDERQTLDAKHNNILQAFSYNKDNVNILQEELDSINSIISNLQFQNAKSPILNMPLQQQIWLYDDKKTVLVETINRIKYNIDETSYMLKTGKLLSNYYKIINEEKSSDSTYNSFEIEKASNHVGKKRNIIDWFQSGIEVDKSINFQHNTEIQNPEMQKTEMQKTEMQNPEMQKTEPHSIIDIMDVKPNFIYHTKEAFCSKDTIYEKFMKLIDKNYININNDNIDIFDTCPTCSIEMLLNNNTGQLICPKCGKMENIIVDSDKPSFKEPPKEMTSFCYKRINHLNEFLAQFQAKETTDIPEDVYNEILLEIKKERITNMVHITPDKMRILLKKIKKNDYYEHIPYIINQLNGLPAPVIAPEIEEIIRGMFKAIQIPFEKYCPNKRKNFLSYNYVMYKFFELLELDEYLACFQLLKSRTKLHQQDQIWKNICKDLNWEFIKSL